MPRTTEERIQIIIDWVQKNPAQLKGLVRSFNNVDKAYEQAHKTLLEGMPVNKKYLELQKYLGRAYVEMYENALKHRKGFQIIQRALELQEQAATANIKRWDGYGKSLSKAGRTMGFYGFIVSFSIQRILRSLQDVAQFFSQSITTTSKWVDGIVEAKTSLAYMKAAGLEGTEAFTATQQVLDQTVENLYANGMKVDAMWRGLNAQWHSIQVTVGTALVPVLQELLGILGKELAKPETQRAIQQLAVAFGEIAVALVPVIPHIVGLAKGLADLLKWFRPWYGIIIQVVGSLFILSSILTVFGPLLSAFGFVIRAVIKMKQLWGRATDIQSLKLARLRSGIALTITGIAMMAAMFFMFSRAASASAKEIGEDYDAMSKQVGGNVVEIMDANGNLIYTINTTTGEVKNANGELIGYWDAMSNTIKNSESDIIGYYDEVHNVFTGIAGEMEGYTQETTTAVQNLETAINGLSFGGLEGSISELEGALGNMDETMGDLDGSLGGLNDTFVIFAAIEFVQIAIGIGKIATALWGMKAAADAATGAQITLEAAGLFGGKAAGIAGGGILSGLASGAGFTSVGAAVATLGPVAAIVAAAIGGLVLGAIPVGLGIIEQKKNQFAHILRESEVRAQETFDTFQEIMSSSAAEAATSLDAGMDAFEAYANNLSPMITGIRRDMLIGASAVENLSTAFLDMYGTTDTAVAAAEQYAANMGLSQGATTQLTNAITELGEKFAEIQATMALGVPEGAMGTEEAKGWIVSSLEELNSVMEKIPEGGAAGIGGVQFVEGLQDAFDKLAYSLIAYYGTAERAAEEAIALADALSLNEELAAMLTGAVDRMTYSLLNTCFSHAGPAAATFTEILQDTVAEADRAAAQIDALTNSLEGVASPGELPLTLSGLSVTGEAATPPTTEPIQYITVYATININGPISSNISLDMIRDAVDQGIGDAWRRRR